VSAHPGERARHRDEIAAPRSPVVNANIDPIVAAL